MTTLDNLLRGICEYPADTHRRLVYADACEDAGDHDRAELIRVQCEITRMLAGINPIHHNSLDMILDPDSAEDQEWKHSVWRLQQRSRQIIHAPAPGLWNPNPGNGYVWSGAALHNAGLHISWKYHNGFPDHITCDCWTWEHHGPKIVASVPVVRVELSDAEPFPPADVQSKRALLWARSVAELPPLEQQP